MNVNELFHQKLEELLNLVFENQPSYATFQGKEGYEKKVGNGTKESYEKFIIKFLEKIEEIKSLNPQKLTKYNALEREKIINSSDIVKFLHDKFPLWKKAPYGVGEILDIIFLILQRKGPTEETLEITIEQLKQLPRFLNEFHDRFIGETIPKLWKEIAEKRLETSTQFFDYLLNIFTINENPASRLQELDLTIKKAKEAVKNHNEWLETLHLDEKDFAWAMGEEAFSEYLKLRKLPWDAETILKKGYQLLKSLTEQAKILAKKIDPSKTFEEVLEEIISFHPLTFEMVLEYAASEVRRAKEFLRGKKLITFPKKENLLVIETPSYLAPILPFAACIPAPYYLSDVPGYYMITRPQTKEGLKKQSYYNISNTMVHEAYPGHHIDSECNNQIGTGYDSVAYYLCSYAAETIEGWAHYCEEMMLEEGFHEESDKVELIILVDQIWRAVRIIVDVELHTKKRNVDEAIEMLLNHTGMDTYGATAEVNRYTTAPTYQLSYLLGKLLIQELRKEQEKELGNSFNLKDFHDKILYSGSLPYYLLKKEFE